ncbi:MAG: RNA polymerase sigma-H factor [Porticoccaceae bacterium]|nr:MAG: RNA polymerase sigma-H factor [Porticoccaceae bacterium]
MAAERASDSDEQLVARARRGDKRAFDLLVLKYQYRLQALVARYFQDPEEIADVVQDTFVKAYRALGNFRGESRFYTWLYRIAVNTAKNHLVARSRRPPADDVEVESAEQLDAGDSLRDVDSPENLFLRDELEELVLRAIDALPEELRTALTLREFEGLSYEEIAKAMGCPVGTVRSRIFRAREAIDREVRRLTGEGVR